MRQHREGRRIEGIYDKEYIDTHSIGFDKVADYVLGKEDGIPKTPEWAKLSMREFEDLPEYETLADMISSQLKKEGVEHAFANEGGKRFLVFKANEAPSVAQAFRQIEESIPEACERAKGALAKGEPLKERAARARAAEQIAQKAGKPREIEIAQARAK